MHQAGLGVQTTNAAQGKEGQPSTHERCRLLQVLLGKETTAKDSGGL